MCTYGVSRFSSSFLFFSFLSTYTRAMWENLADTCVHMGCLGFLLLSYSSYFFLLTLAPEDPADARGPLTGPVSCNQW